MKFKILSWNIWCGTYLNEVKEFLKNSNADIISLQEVVIDERGNIGEIIAKELGYEYAHAVLMDIPVKFLPRYKSNEKEKIKYGPAILSKYPIVNSKVIELSRNKKFIRYIIKADIKIKNEVFHVFSIHLKHTHQKQLDIQDLEVKNLLSLLPKSNSIVIGDFNSLPKSTVIKKMDKNLENSEKGSPIPTWSVYKDGCICLSKDKEIIYKLDYIFTSKNLKTNSFKVYESKASDHLPISTIVKI